MALIQVQQVFGQSKDSEELVPPEVEELLRSFSGVFAEPTELPPCRGGEHRIKLKNSERATTVKPYRYAHFQKMEVEKQVQAYVSKGLVSSSVSAFSSPSLLVKKKEGE